jgi:hypothetical protein
MRRLTRHLFTLCSAVSLLLCVAACVLWVRSYFATDMLTLHSESVSGGTYRQVYRLVDSGRGMLLVHRGVIQAAPVDPPPGYTPTSASRRDAEFPVNPVDRWALSRATSPAGQVVHFAPGVTVRQDRSSEVTIGHAALGTMAATYEELWIAVPHWLLALVAAILPTVFGVRFVRRRRLARLGLCPACGYDLRASPERCPECGMPQVAALSADTQAGKASR